MQHPLIFLTVRSVVNGVKRSLTNARRLISLIFATAYYVLFFFRPFSRPSGAPVGKLPVHFAIPDHLSIQTGLFLLFALTSILLSTGVMNSRGGFSPADVDVLFATPVSPKVVLGFRILRDGLLTLFVPLIVVLATLRPAGATVRGFSNQFPQLAGYLIKACSVTWLLVSVTWVAIGYAVSISVTRTDLQSDLYRKRIGWTMFAVICSTLIYLAISLRLDATWATIERVTSQPLVNATYVIAWAATSIVMSPITGNWFFGGLGLLIFVGVIGLSLKVAMAQAGWMYDQAAARGFDTHESVRLRKQGDIYTIHANLARKGLLRIGSVSQHVASTTVRGPLSLLWRDMIVLTRTSGVGLFFQPLLGLVAVACLWSLPAFPENQAGWMFLSVLGLMVLSLSLGAQSSFIELLRRGDIQKPLPFAASTIVFVSIVSAAIPFVGMGLVAALGCAIVRPDAWTYALTAIPAVPCLALALVANGLLVTVLFPDIDDPTQRGFRQLMILVGAAIVGLPSVGLLAGLLFARVPVLLSLIPFCAINIGIAFGVASVAGGLYASYNPSE